MDLKRLITDTRRERKYQKRLAEYKSATRPSLFRVYVLVRDDILPPLHQGIQAAHAVVRLGNEIDRYGSPETKARWKQWKHFDETLILLAGSTLAPEAQLIHPRSWAYFWEPDLGIITATAIAPITSEEAAAEPWLSSLRLAS